MLAVYPPKASGRKPDLRPISRDHKASDPYEATRIEVFYTSRLWEEENKKSLEGTIEVVPPATQLLPPQVPALAASVPLPLCPPRLPGGPQEAEDMDSSVRSGDSSTRGGKSTRTSSRTNLEGSVRSARMSHSRAGSFPHGGAHSPAAADWLSKQSGGRGSERSLHGPSVTVEDSSLRAGWAGVAMAAAEGSSGRNAENFDPAQLLGNRVSMASGQRAARPPSRDPARRLQPALPVPLPQPCAASRPGAA